MKTKITKSDLGLPISADLSESLKPHVSSDERADVGANTGFSFSLATQLIARRANLTKDNSEMLRGLIEVARKNCENSIATAKRALEVLESTEIDL